MSDNGKVIAFTLEQVRKYRIVVNDTLGPVYDWVTIPALSADGMIVAYGATAQNDTLFIHGERKIALKKKVIGVFLSSDGKSVGWINTDLKPGHQRVTVGDKEGPLFQGIVTPVFSPDAKHIVYYAMGIDDTPYVVIDERKLEAWGLESLPVFLNDGKKIGYGVRKGRELWWKVLDVK